MTQQSETNDFEVRRDSPAVDRLQGWYARWGKRCFDLVAGSVLGVLLLPIILVSAVLVAIKLGRPVLFRQQRSGLNGKSFEIIKFRSMTDGRDSNGELLPDTERLTSFGKFLRASSIDEFPEIWNVLKGDMSLVGPRPLLEHYMELYSTEQLRRHDVLPGVTGCAQVNGRNSLSWDEKFAFDIWYVENFSLWTDIKILLKTVTKVFVRSGVTADGHATMPYFEGNQEDTPNV